MAIAEFSKLATELREEIWLLALLPEPGVYKFDPTCFHPCRMGIAGKTNVG